MIKDIIKQNNLTCTEQEFNEYMNSLEIDLININSSIHTFDELYNWVQVENPCNSELYYTLNIWWTIYLQTHEPLVSWLNPITKDNVDDIILKHKLELQSNYIQSKIFELTIQHFTPKEIIKI